MTPVAPRHLETALACVADAVIMIDVDGRITYLNAAAEILTDKSNAEATGELLSLALSNIDSTIIAAIENAIRAVRDGPASLSRADARFAASLGPVEFSVSSLTDDSGAACGAVILCRDANPRRTVERALRLTEEELLANEDALFEEKERARVTLQSIGDAVISTDFRGRVSFLNNIAESMTGWTQEEAAGRQLDETFTLIDSSTRAHVESPAMRAIIENRTIRIDVPCALVQRDGLESAVEVSASPIHDRHKGVIGAVMVAHDVSEARDLSSKLAKLALYDSLTGLPNRTLLADRLSHALDKAQRNRKVVSLLFIDLDRFKPVNDTLGHAIGDQLLQAVARRLQACVRCSDTVSRHGGDEFVIILAELADARHAARCAEEVILAIGAPFDIGQHQLRISASIGIAGSVHGSTGAAALLKNADTAMYEAKSGGRNNYRFFG